MISYEKAKPLGSVSLNYEVVGGTTAPTTFKKENTIWINTDVEIGEHEFSYVHSSVLKDSNKTGKATSTTMFDAGATALRVDSVGRSAIFECLPDTNYEIHKSAGNLWYIATTQEIPADGVTINILNSVEDSSDTINITTDSNANYLVVFVSNASVEPDITLTCLDIIYTRADGSDLQNGDVWIQTDIDKAPVGFNAIKKNELMVYPYKLKRWHGSTWDILTGTLYRDDIVMRNYERTVEFYPGRTVELVSNYGGSYNLDNFTIYLSSTTRGENSPSLAIPVDLTGLSKLTINGNFNITNGKGYLGVFLYPTKNTTGAHNTVGDQLDSTHYTLMDRIVCDSNGSSSSATSFVLDVSSLTGVYYLHMTGYANRDSSSTAVVINGDIDTIVGEMAEVI